MKKFFSSFKFWDWILFSAAVLGTVLGIIFLSLPEFVKRDRVTEKLGHVEYMTNDVRLRPVDSFQWFFLHEWFKESIHNHDQLYTEKDSTATVYLLNGETVYLQPGSLIRFSKDHEGEIQLNVTYGEIKAEGPVVRPPQIIKKKQKIVMKPKSFEVKDFEPTPDDVMPAKSLPEKPSSLSELPVATVPHSSEPSVAANPIGEPTEPSEQPPVENSVAEAVPQEALAPPETEVASAETPATPESTPQPEPALPPKEPKKKVPTSFLTYAETINPELIRPTIEGRLKGEIPKVKVQWKPIKNAESYVVQVRGLLNGKEQVVKKVRSKTTQVEIPFEYNGEFKVNVISRVTATRSPASIPIQKATKSFVVPTLEVLPKPAGLFPRNKQLLITNKSDIMYFKWQKSVRFSLYAVQFSKDKDFKTIDKEILITTFQTKENPDLSEGVWYWRVKGLSQTGESPWGPVQEFKLVYE